MQTTHGSQACLQTTQGTYGKDSKPLQTSRTENYNALHTAPTLPDKLKSFYARFDPSADPSLTSGDNQALTTTHCSLPSLSLPPPPLEP